VDAFVVGVQNLHVFLYVAKCVLLCCRNTHLATYKNISLLFEDLFNFEIRTKPVSFLLRSKSDFGYMRFRHRRTRLSAASFQCLALIYSI
jgi:hypothetical protein